MQKSQPQDSAAASNGATILGNSVALVKPDLSWYYLVQRKSWKT